MSVHSKEGSHKHTKPLKKSDWSKAQAVLQKAADQAPDLQNDKPFNLDATEQQALCDVLYAVENNKVLGRSTC